MRRLARTQRMQIVAVLTWVGSAALANEPEAGRITRENAPRVVLGGSDAVGGVDDWFLGNGVICGIVTDPAHESDLAVGGGALADLGLCGRDDDQFILYQELLNHSMDSPSIVKSVQAEAGDGTASLVTNGAREDVRVTTRFSVDSRLPRRLRIETRATRVAPGPRFIGIAGGLANVRSLEAFAVSLGAGRPSRGYVHPRWSGLGAGALRQAAISSELSIAVGAPGQEPGVAYGQRLVSARRSRADSEAEPIPAFFLPEGIATVLSVFAEPFWFGQANLGWLQLLQASRQDLDLGTTMTIEQEIWVGERSDAAAVTDLLLPDAPLITGRCDSVPCSVHVDRADGRPFTERRADADGRFSMRLPTGNWKLRVRAAADREVIQEIQVAGQALDLGTLAVGPAATLRLPQGNPMRLVFIGQGETPDPNWSDDLRGYRMGTNEGQFRSVRPLRDLHLSGGPSDLRAVSLAPGSYEIIATHGPEFELSRAHIELTAGTETTLQLAAPTRAFDTPGWISADLHVHGAASFDTPTPNDRRVASYLAEGAEVLVSSDHENVHDYGPDVVRLGLQGKVVTVVGLEITGEVRTAEFPNSTGHANVLPMPRDPWAYRRGAVDNENRRLREILADLRALPGERLFQLNHPRTGDESVHWRSYLTHMGSANRPYDPTHALTAEPNRSLVEAHPETGLRDLDFDAMEILNGRGMSSRKQVLRDWLSFLVQGEHITGTANSDSHTLESVVAAPRNYVRVVDDQIAAFDEAEFISSLRRGHVCGTNGPWLSVRLGDAGPGEVATGPDHTLRAAVESASWVPVDQIRIWRNSELWREFPIPEDGEVSVPLEFTADGLIVVEVFGKPSADYSAVLPGHVPYGFCNPIRVDVDGDGSWDPPGL